MFPPVSGSARILMAPAAAYGEFIERRISAAKRLTESLFEWMTLDLQHELDAIKSHPVPNPIETMHALQLSLDKALQKREQIEGVIQQVQEKAGVAELADVMRIAFLSPLDEEIAYLNRGLSEAQAAAEKDSAA